MAYSYLLSNQPCYCFIEAPAYVLERKNNKEDDRMKNYIHLTAATTIRPASIKLSR